MKNLYLTIAIMLLALVAQAQTITIVDPAGLTAPYEVSPGTEVTFELDFFGDDPTVLTHDEEPDFSGFGLDPEWGQSTNTVDNGDGTFNYTLTVTEDIWVWGGVYMPFLMNWNFSEVIHLIAVSDVEVIFEDGVVCGDGVDTELLSVEDTYDDYQWYLNNSPIDGATESTYQTTVAGDYKVEVLSGGEWIFSNTVQITAPSIEISGSFNEGDLELVMTADGGFDSYQWLSGPSEDDLTAIDGATDQSYSATLEAEEVFYAVSATIGACTVTSAPGMVSTALFETPVIDIDAVTNGNGDVCPGNTVILSVDGNYENYEWFFGAESYGEMDQFYIYNASGAGSYTVAVSPMGWPDVTLVSEAVEVSFVNIISPELLSSTAGPYCPGEEVTVLLGDEGYDYNWYVHSGFNYTEEDLIEVEGYSYTFTFEDQVYVSVEALYQGCSESSTLNLNSAADAYLPVSMVNWDQQYLCTDSIAYMEVSEWDVPNFNNFQWYQNVDDEWEAIDGANDPMFGASQPGMYAVEANVAACEDVTVMSSPMEIMSFEDRELYLFADDQTLCMGDETELHISGGDSWMQIQWFNREIQMGTNGYEEVYTPMIGGGSEASQIVTEFNYYIAKARHESCPTGVKISSNVVSMRPTVNPDISVDPDYGVESVKPSPYGDINVHLYCSEEPVDLSVPDTYDSYSWHSMGYTGDGGYYLGDATPGEEEPTTTFIATGADWVTAQVDSAGCVGVSNPVLIDTWVFQNPAIASYNNSEICTPGDSTLIHIAFEGNYEWIEWYNYDTLVPEENDDSLWVTEPGMYIVTVYREECPQFGLSSGIGPTVTFLEPYIVEDDDLIYAMPHEGFYDFQWYLDGEPFDAPLDTPWILYKADMPEGEYTVEVTNPEPCTAESDPFVWTTSGVEDDLDALLGIFPNPTMGEVVISGIEIALVESIQILDINGKVRNAQIHGNRLDLGSLSAGMYVVELKMKDGQFVRRKVLKN